MADEGAGDPGRSGRGPALLRVSWRLWNLKAPEWRTAGWLGALLVAGLILLTARPATAPKQGIGNGGPAVAAASGGAAADPLQPDENAIEASLASALAGIAGAGAITVRVHLQEGPVTDFAVNTQVTDSTSGQTSQGGNGQSTTQHSQSSQLATPASGGGPPVQSIEAPTISGVLVVAGGASDAGVRAELTAAVQAATGVPLYKIVVLPAAVGSDSTGALGATG